MTKQADTATPIHELLARRWSPYGFTGENIAIEDLRAVFEAARWAPSSYNEQPWRFIVATRDDRDEFDRIISCLAEPNQAWAKNAAVLALGVVSHNFERNGKSNRAAVHDLGLAAANIVFEATARGLFVHQMIGLDPDRGRDVFNVPDNYEVYTALAIGHRADTSDMPEELAERDTAPRTRKTLDEFVFHGQFGEAASWTK